MLKNTAVVLLVLLVLFASRIRIITADGCTLLLFDNPAHAGSSSFGRKVKEDFASAGKTPDNVTIQYIGTNSGGDYFLCEYRESDGSVSKYYAFEDNDHNSGLPAKVLWE